MLLPVGDSVVTCYFRHLQEVFKEVGIEITSGNKREVDMIIHGIVGVPYKNCPATWREVKKRMADDADGFVSALKTAWEKRGSPGV
jgi:hypothetical protein